MKKIAIIIVVMLFFSALPLTIGTEVKSEQKEDSTTDIGWTFLRGIITKPRLTNLGNEITFRAIRIHYRTRGIGGDAQGVLRGLQKITLPNDFNGILNNHYVFAKFDGRLEI